MSKHRTPTTAMIRKPLVRSLWLAGLLGLSWSGVAAEKPPASPVAAAEAAQEHPVFPTPIVPSAPDRAEWVVRMTGEFDGSWESGKKRKIKSVKASTTSVAQSVEVSKDAARKIYRLRTHWNDGVTEEEWIVMGQRVAARPGGRGYYIVNGESAAGPDPGGSDFPELGWLKPSHYQGIRTYNGNEVFRFVAPFDQRTLSEREVQMLMLAKQREPELTPARHFKPKVLEVVVYLDAKTRLPVLYNDGSIIRTYSFGAVAGEQPSPPPRIVELLEKRKLELEKVLLPPTGP